MTGGEGIDSLKWLKSAIPKAFEGVPGIIAYRDRYISYKHNASLYGDIRETPSHAFGMAVIRQSARRQPAPRSTSPAPFPGSWPLRPPPRRPMADIGLRPMAGDNAFPHP